MKKKLWIIILLAIIFLGLHSNIYAYSSQTQRFITLFERQMKTMDKEKKLQYLDLIASILDAPSVKSNNKTEVRTLVNELNQWINESKGVKNISTTTKTTSSSAKEKVSDWVNYQTLPNVDYNKVREARLQWHNDLRTSLGVQLIQYHSDLEKSAVNRSNYLASNSITEGTHKRKEGDGYYNYNSLKEWFWDLWIYFVKETWGKSVFSESVWYRRYTCSAWDCTQALIDATKKVFDSFASEWANWAHYKAIVMPHYNYMWIGFQFDPNTKYVYTVIHYAEKIVEG